VATYLSTLLLLSSCVKVMEEPSKRRDTDATTTDTSVITDTGVTTTETDTGSMTTDTEVDTSFSLSGNTIDMATMTPVSSGALCMTIADPTAAIAGGDLIILTQTTIEATTGAWATEAFETDSAVGLFMIASDCDGTATVVFPTATGMSADSYAEAGDGEVIDSLTSISVSMMAAGGINQSLAAAGSSMNLLDNGAMAGFVFDSMGVPVGGATVCGSDCADTYYFDTAMNDGLFTTAGSGVNAATAAAANGSFIVPGASVYTYVVDDGGAHEWWDSLLFGAVPGLVSFVQFVAN
jgi:hypothetical protein